jgi:hypothetical protein
VTRAFTCLIALAASAFPADQSGERFFDKRVAPILIRRCLGCHNQQLNNGGISFLDRESLLRRGPRGPAIVPGDPAASLLVTALRHDSGIQMPPGPKLPSKEIAILTEWIRRGAVWGTTVKLAKAPHPY